MKPTFLKYDRPLLCVMVQADNPLRIKQLIDKSLPKGAEAFGMQFCKMKPEFRNRDVYKELFSCTKGRPVYITNYRHVYNNSKTDDELADELIELAGCGATLCDVMGDLFDKQPDELAFDKGAVNRQIALIDRLHQKGAEVLMSSHIYTFTPAERVLEIGLEHQRRRADISKIVVGADNMEQQLENLKIINLLRQRLNIPFLFLSAGECRILRRIGGEFGCCMYLCVYEYDKFSTSKQPLLKPLKAIRDNMNL